MFLFLFLTIIHILPIHTIPPTTEISVIGMIVIVVIGELLSLSLSLLLHIWGKVGSNSKMLNIRDDKSCFYCGSISKLNSNGLTFPMRELKSRIQFAKNSYG